MTAPIKTQRPRATVGEAVKAAIETFETLVAAGQYREALEIAAAIPRPSTPRHVLSGSEFNDRKSAAVTEPRRIANALHDAALFGDALPSGLLLYLADVLEGKAKRPRGRKTKSPHRARNDAIILVERVAELIVKGKRAGKPDPLGWALLEYANQEGWGKKGTALETAKRRYTRAINMIRGDNNSGNYRPSKKQLR